MFGLFREIVRGLTVPTRDDVERSWEATIEIAELAGEKDFAREMSGLLKAWRRRELPRKQHAADPPAKDRPGWLMTRGNAPVRF